MQVTIPPATIPSWQCLFSGLTPEQLGFFSWHHPKKGLLNSYIWRDNSIFSQINKRSFIMNVPGTYPSWKVNGEMIAGMMSPKISCFPPELNFILGKNWIINGKSVKESFKAFHLKSKLFLRKLEEDFDFMVYVIKIPDNATHTSKTDHLTTLKMIYRSYVEIDKFLGEILRSNKVKNLVIFSDHGLKHFKYEFYLKRWLEKKRLLFLNNLQGQILSNILLKLYDYFRFLDISSPIKKYINSYIKNKKMKKPKKKGTPQPNLGNKTRIQGFTANVGAIFLNDKDKKKKDKIILSLQNDLTFKKVIPYDIEGFPDLFIILDDKYLFGKESSLYLKRKRDTYKHHEIGMFLAYGTDIKAGRSDNISYLDVAPTILRLLNVIKPEYMKGKALPIFN